MKEENCLYETAAIHRFRRCATPKVRYAHKRLCRSKNTFSRQIQRKNSGKWENAPEYGLARKGLICLQDHGYPAWFRNIKIRELPRKTEEEELFNGKDLTG